jgi:hypothetical protein
MAITSVSTVCISVELEIGTVITAQGSIIAVGAEFHLRNNSIVYSTSRMWATGWSQP